MNDNPIPPKVLDILARYALGQGGALTGSTRPLVENDLMAAMQSADYQLAAGIKATASWIWNELDTDAYGSPEKVRAWTMRGEVAKHPDAPRVLRLERDQRGRLGPDTWLVNRYVLARAMDMDERREVEVPIFVECVAIVASEATGVSLLEASAVKT